MPIIPAHTPRIRYSVPMSLWLVDISHRTYYVSIGKIPSMHVDRIIGVAGVLLRSLFVLVGVGCMLTLNATFR